MSNIGLSDVEKLIDEHRDIVDFATKDNAVDDEWIERAEGILGLKLSKRLATAACESGYGIVSLELRLIQRELYSWNTQPTGELNPAHSIPTTLNFASLNWLLTPTPTSQK